MKAVSRTDREIGIEQYATQSAPCHAKVKQVEEDFQVEELLTMEGVKEEPIPGYYPLYRVEKRSIDTMHMGDELAKVLGSRVSYGGLKDKEAVAIQYVTPTRSLSSTPKSIDKSKFSARLIGYAPRRVSRGSVAGNRFTITLRECCPDIGSRARDVIELARKKRLPNYFGYQRFGAQVVGTHDIGRAIVKRDFRGAVELILGRHLRVEDGGPKATDATEVGQGGGNPRLNSGQDTERAVAGSLARSPTDHVRALRAAPPRLRRFYVQAFQSFIFNKTLSSALARALDISAMEDGDNWAELDESGLGIKKIHGVREPKFSEGLPVIQLAGYGFRDYGSRFDKLTMEAMAQEGVTAKDFYINELQEASAEGGFRVPHMRVMDAKLEIEREGTAVLGFVLARGQYATVFLREIIKPDDPRASGLA